MKLTEQEQQLVCTLNWFRSRYALFQGLKQDRQANKKAINFFGETWLGQFKLDWTEAFDSLLEKGILILNKAEYSFSALGIEIKTALEKDTPFFKFEYDNFFALEKNSLAHHQFCEQVYGQDLSQHGLINKTELEILISKLKIKKPKSVLDLGCGNGKITSFLFEQIPTNYLGIDISSVGIEQANSQTENKENLKFEIQNFDQLTFPDHSFDAILSLDTLYYSDDLSALIKKLMKFLTTDGLLYCYFSQWIMGDEYLDYAPGNQTKLARTLEQLGLSYQYTDLTQSGIDHWNLKLQTLLEMKQTFLDEGNKALWEYRFREADRYANWNPKHYFRYFYEISL